MEVASLKDFIINNETVMATVVSESSKYVNNEDSLNPQLVKSWLLRMSGPIFAETVTDKSTHDEYPVTKTYTKLGYTYFEVTERNNAFL